MGGWVFKLGGGWVDGRTGMLAGGWLSVGRADELVIGLAGVGT